jgi:hypothetical protein
MWRKQKFSTGQSYTGLLSINESCWTECAAKHFSMLWRTEMLLCCKTRRRRQFFRDGLCRGVQFPIVHYIYYFSVIFFFFCASFLVCSLSYFCVFFFHSFFGFFFLFFVQDVVQFFLCKSFLSHKMSVSFSLSRSLCIY